MKFRHAVIGFVGGLLALATTLLVAVATPPFAQPGQQKLTEQTVADVKFQTVPGFAIERVNPPARTDSYVVITFDSLGRPVVSKEQDHPRILIDADKDGVYEGEKVFSTRVRNCQGLWFDARTLYGVCTMAPAEGAPAAAPAGGGRQGGGQGGGQPTGIYKMTDTNGDDEADTFETVTTVNGSIAEHGPHAIRRDPDGGFSTIFGNFATIVDGELDPKTPILGDKEAQFLPELEDWRSSTRDGVHSAVYRWDPAIKKFTIVFGGLRNAYDLAFNSHGEVFTFDSDMEYDINMPWFRDVRTVHGIPAGNYGYRNNSGKLPPYYIDSLPPVRDLGRGSPVGVEFYQSYAYPKEYFDNFLEADWSRGRLLFTALTPAGATYTARADRAELVHGEPFNVTDVEVGPDGMLYFSTGGRGTSGGVWRLRYAGGTPQAPDMSGILSVVRQPQPLSSWGWAAIEAVKTKMGGAFGAELAALATSATADGMDRARALYELQRHGPPPSVELLQSSVKDTNADVRRAAAYIAGMQGEKARAVAAAGLKDSDALVKRRSAEAVVRMGQWPDKPSLVPVADLLALLNDGDRFVRWAARTALERTPRADWKDRVLVETNPVGALEGLVAWIRTAGKDSLEPALEKVRELAALDLSPDDALRLFRTFELVIIDARALGTPEVKADVYGYLADRFPAKDERLNREMAILMAWSGDPGAIGEILAAMPKGDENQQLQIHYAYALMAEWLGRAADWRGGASYARFMGQIFDQTTESFTDEEKQVAYQKAPEYAPLSADEMKTAPSGGRGGQPPATATPGTTAGQRGSTSAIAQRTQGVSRTSKQEVFEYHIFVPQRNPPVAAEGQKLFAADCASCHKFGDTGVSLGPNGPPS